MAASTQLTRPQSAMERPISQTPQPAISIADMYKIATGKDQKYGIPGYFLPKKSVLYHSVSHMVPKEKSNNFIDQQRRQAKQTPGHKYDVRPTWNSSRGKFAKKTKTTFIDDVKKKSKETPGPGAYKHQPVGFTRVEGGKMDKTKGINIFTTCQYYAKESPGAGKYEPNHNYVRPQSAHAKWREPKAKAKVGKVKVGPGSYNDQNVYLRLASASTRGQKMSREESVRGVFTNRDSIKHVPGVGHYNLDAALTKISKGPCMRKR